MKKQDKSKILIHISGGIGNIIQTTPMIQSLAKAGYSLDICIQYNNADVLKLIYDKHLINKISLNPTDFRENEYDYYIIGWLVNPPYIRFKNFENTPIIALNYSIKHIDLYSEREMYLNISQLLDKNISIENSTYCIAHGNSFPDISKNTCILGLGGYKTWVFKKWDKYDLFADKFNDVAVIGQLVDLDFSNCYYFPKWIEKHFKKYLEYHGKIYKALRLFAKKTYREMHFRSHVKNYIGKLSLLDSAALINQAGFFIGNDCGLAHIAIAFKKPTFILMGPTSARKNIPNYPHVHIIHLDYECQPCQEKNPKILRLSSTRHFCPYGIRCLRDLNEDFVYKKIKNILEEKHNIIL